MAEKTMVEQATEVLQWATKNKKTLTEALKHFGLSAGYLRRVRASKKGSKGYDNFLKAYNVYKGTVIPGNNPAGSKIVDDDLGDGQQRFQEGSDGTASYQYKGDKMLKSLDDAIKFFKIDTRLWEVTQYLCNSYPVSARRREQDLKWDISKSGQQVMQGYSKRLDEWTTQVNYQVKVWLKKRVEVAAAMDFEKFYIDMLRKHKPVRYPKIKYEKLQGKESKNVLEVNIFDLHLGKLCWSDEVLNNYDTKIASKRFRYALETLVRRGLSSGFERILFPVGNDFFNSDNHLNTTTAGTRQDDDSRWQKTFNTGVKLLVEGIDFMKQYAPVDVLVIPGNHDATRSFVLGATLAAWYRQDESVKIDNSSSPRKYYEYGQNLIGLTHGNLEKPEALRSLMSFEAKQAWARTTYREFHLGHNHRKLAVKYTVDADLDKKPRKRAEIIKESIIHEELALVVRSMGSLAGTDAYHHMMGYVGPIRAAEAYLWNFYTGLIGSFNSNIIIGDDE